MGFKNNSLVDTELSKKSNLPIHKFGSVGKREFEGVGVRHSLNDHVSPGILPIAKSSFGLDEVFRHEIKDWVLPGSDVSGWRLPGHGDPYDDCGDFWKKGCLDVESHNQSRIDDVDVVGKVYVKVVRRSCGRAECPICYEKWAGKEAHKIEYRLKQWKGRGKVIHLVLSPPAHLWGLSPEVLRRKSYQVAKKVHFLGGSCIFHPFREEEGSKRWYFSPHFHMLGFGWIEGTAENYESSGWIVKNVGIRQSVSSTALYQLSHCGVHERFHSVTWFGFLAYNKLKVVPEVVEKEKCPLCGAELVKLMWIGDGDPPIPDLEGDYFVDPGGWVEGVRLRRLLYD